MSPQELTAAMAEARVEMEAHFQQWGARLDEMKARLEDGEIEDRIEFHKQVEASQQRHELARQHLDELRQAGEAAWTALKAGVDLAWQELESSIQREQK